MNNDGFWLSLEVPLAFYSDCLVHAIEKCALRGVGDVNTCCKTIILCHILPRLRPNGGFKYFRKTAVSGDEI